VAIYSTNKANEAGSMCRSAVFIFLNVYGYRSKNVYSMILSGTFFGALFHEKDFARTHAISQTGNSPVSKLDPTLDRLQLKGQNLGRVFNFRNGHVLAVHFLCYGVKQPNLKLKIQAN
jgi:hypothetical protein